jgi:formiminotetrahydrofolate cyclodeaminase
MNKENLGCRYQEVQAIHALKHLLRHDKDALFRVMNAIKEAIYEEESRALTERTIQKAKK